MTLTTYGTKIDVRELASRDRHPAIFATYRSLAVGEALELLDDRDPRPLHLQFEADMPASSFRWDSLQSGPELWRVRITKVRNQHRDGPCCGSCGGA